MPAMTSEEAYGKLADRVRAAMSQRKQRLYRELALIESFDELKGYELVRSAGLHYPAQVGESTIRATDEQKDAFKIFRGQREWRAYIDEVARVLDECGD